DSAQLEPAVLDCPGAPGLALAHAATNRPGPDEPVPCRLRGVPVRVVLFHRCRCLGQQLHGLQPPGPAHRAGADVPAGATVQPPGTGCRSSTERYRALTASRLRSGVKCACQRRKPASASCPRKAESAASCRRAPAKADASPGVASLATWPWSSTCSMP